jgi:hypothetical protein
MADQSKVFLDYREQTRLIWGVNTDPSYKITDHQLQLGALLRLADASERICKFLERMEPTFIAILKALTPIVPDPAKGKREREKASRVRSQAVYDAVSAGQTPTLGVQE